MKNVLLITGNKRRHKYAANVISKNLNLCGVVFESKFGNKKQKNISDSKNNIIVNHFDEREEAEKKYLGENTSLSKDVHTINVDHGKSNSESVFQWVKNQNPDILLLYGSSIIKPPLLNFFEGRIINMHLGLSPYYRGSGTNFWPLVDGLPECVGATIHLATSKVDAGSILTQVRPQNIFKNDRAHDLGTKTIIAGLNKLCNVVPRYLNNEIKLFEQDLTIGKLCRRKDFSEKAVKKLWENLSNGMIEQYLEQKRLRDSKYPIIEQ